MEGLEISIIPYQEAIQTDFTGRLDASFFDKKFIRLREKTAHWNCLSSYAKSVVCGPFGSSILNGNYVDTGIPMVRPFNLRNFQSNQGDVAYLDEKFVSDVGLKIFPSGTVMFARVGDVGAGVSFAEKATISPNIIAAELKDSINPLFVGVFANSIYGRMQLESGMKVVAQPTISTESIRSFRIPPQSRGFQDVIGEIFSQAIRSQVTGVFSLQKAEAVLLHTLKLLDWQAPEPLTYTRSSSDAFAAGRLDAEYFSPRVSGLMQLLARDGLTVADVAPARHQRFTPGESGHFHYIEIGGLGSDGTASSELVLQREAPSRATQYVNSGDVITSTVRPIRRLTAVVDPAQDGHVCSSGFVVLKPTHIAPEVLMTYLRLPPVCKLMDLHTSASLYPAISEKDLLALPIPRIAQNTQESIKASVLAAHQAKQRATQLLDAAKQAVEIAIENSESAALDYLASVA